MFTQEMTDDEKLNYCYGQVIRRGKRFLFSEDGFRILQYLEQNDHSCADVDKALEAMYLHIVGLSK